MKKISVLLMVLTFAAAQSIFAKEMLGERTYEVPEISNDEMVDIMVERVYADAPVFFDRVFALMSKNEDLSVKGGRLLRKYLEAFENSSLSGKLSAKVDSLLAAAEEKVDSSKEGCNMVLIIYFAQKKRFFAEAKLRVAESASRLAESYLELVEGALKTSTDK